MKIALATKPLLAALFIVCVMSANAQDLATPEFVLRRAAQRNIPTLKKQISQYQIVNFPTTDISKFVKKNNGGRFRLSLAGDTTLGITLEPSEIASTNYKLKILTPEGTKIINSKPDYLYKGKVLGKHGGEVRLTIRNAMIEGYITSGEKEFNVEPLSKYVKDCSADEYVVYDKRDVTADTNLPYDIETDSLISSSTDKNRNSLERLLSGQCKKIKVLQVTDYQMLQQFNNNIDSLEAFLFTNMNQVQGVYHGFNFGLDSTMDVGEDSVQFEIFETIISTCSNCDILSQGNNSTELNGLMRNWVKNYSEPNEFISQFWSPRRLFSQTLEAVGISNGLYCNRSFQLLRYYTNNPVALRFLAAHETGHNLGCIHDNQVKSDVNQFFMNSYFVPSATRFSRLSDFGGALLAGNLYSSQLTFRNYILSAQQCFNACTEPTNCNIVDGLAVTSYQTSDSVKVTWNGAGKFKVILKEKNLYDLSSVDSSVEDNNFIVFKNLNPCTTYQVILSRLCDNANSSPPVSFIFLNGAIEMSSYGFNNIRFSKYDLQINVKHNLKQNTPFYVFVDHQPYKFYSSDSPDVVSVRDLFSDGARHRIDIRQEITNQSCTRTYYYHAPYFREKALVLLKNDFDDSCNLGEWKDSILLTLDPTLQLNPLVVSDMTKTSLAFLPGTIDSSCFAADKSLFNFSDPTKRYSLTSPAADITKYSNIMMSFDYNYYTYYWRDTSLNSYLAVEVYDGSRWNEVFKQKAAPYFHNINFNKAIFDTLPPRAFVSLDSFKNKNFRVRFVFDNGMEQPNVHPFYVVALDNIRVDGYLSTTTDVSKLEFRIYPNPAQDEIFLVFDQPVANHLNYRIVDMMGRTVDVGTIVNDRIKLKMPTRGIYMLQVFYGATLIDHTKKVIKN
jgi:Secretion system C-terminal sorting domain